MKKLIGLTLGIALALGVPALADRGGSDDNSGPGRSGDDAAETEVHHSDDHGGNSGACPAGELRERRDDENRARSFFRATEAGAGIRAKGHIDIRVREMRQKFTVEVEARVPDGTTFLVLADGQPAGVVRTVFGEGELELKNFDGHTLPAAVNPVASVRRVEVWDASGHLVLEANI